MEEGQKERVLITGGSGYIGSTLTGHLLDQGFQVTCLDNLSYSQKSLLHYTHNPNFEFINGDSRDEALLTKIVPQFEIIIPLAAVVGMPACEQKPIEASSINHEAIVLINKLRSPNQKLIFPNTNSGYGTKISSLLCTEETPLEPISHYGKTKCKAELHLLESEKPAITLRLATVFGVSPRMRTDLLVNDFVWKAMSDGYIIIYEKDFKRNYLHVRDAARAFEHAIKNFDSMKNNSYNVGLEDANLSKAELAEKIKEYIPSFEIVYKEVSKDPDKRNYIVSNKKILNTGFLPKYTLDDGIKELIKAYFILLKNKPYTNL